MVEDSAASQEVLEKGGEEEEALGSSLLPKLGLPAKAAFALLLTGVCYLLMVSVRATLGSVPSLNYIANVILERGIIPYLELGAFWFGVASLALLTWSRRTERSQFSRLREAWGELEATGKLGEELFMERLNQLPSALTSGSAYARLAQCVSRVEKTGHSEGLDQVLNTLRELDVESQDAKYQSLRYLTWLLPTLGFLGTVSGMGQGLLQFGGMVQSAGSFSEVQAQVPQVTSSLAIAFDTTFLALILTVVISWWMGVSQGADEELLRDIDRFCLTEFALAKHIDEKEALFTNLLTKLDQIFFGYGESVKTGLKEAVLEGLETVFPIRLSFPTIEKSLQAIEHNVESLSTAAATHAHSSPEEAKAASDEAPNDDVQGP